MRKSLRLLPLLLLAVTQITAQSVDRFAFAITDADKNGINWTTLRKLDLQTGEYTQVLLNGTADQVVFDATSKKVHQPNADVQYGNYMKSPFATGVAAMAYDKRNNRLYFTPMFIDQLRYIDLKTMKLYYVTDQKFTTLGNMHNDEGKVVSRMVIAPDGYGYAVTNDANTLIRFSTNKKLKIEQLGSIVDDPKNGPMSIHNRCTSWGGDMVADDDGNLYVFSARNVMYKINIETKVASLQQPITGLPAGFTINGAVVNDNNQVLVSSATNNKAWYVIDPKTWEAAAYSPANGVYMSSDLANSNYLNTRGRNTSPETVSRRAEPTAPAVISVFPNPVTTGQFVVQFGRIPAGNYNIELNDMMGRVVSKRMVNVAAEGQAETVLMPRTAAKGVYL